MSNLELVTPPNGVGAAQAGYNLFKVWFAEAPESAVSSDYGVWKAACAWAQYDPAGIRVPTLLIHAEWDADLPSDQAWGYFAKLTNAPYKRFVEIGEGTHSVIMEKNRMQFFREIMNFLNERDPQGVN